MGFVDYEEDGYVGIMTINRPQALNALNKDVLKDIEAALMQWIFPESGTIILTGAGEKSFVAGADIAAMSTMTKAEGEVTANSAMIFFVKSRLSRFRLLRR